MVRKARRSASQWDSGMPMVHLKPRESGDVWMIFFVSLCGGRLLMYFSMSRKIGTCVCTCELFHYCLQTSLLQTHVSLSLIEVVLGYLCFFGLWMKVTACSKLLVWLLLGLIVVWIVCVSAYMCIQYVLACMDSTYSRLCAWFSCLLCFSVPQTVCGFGKGFHFFPALLKSLAMRGICIVELCCWSTITVVWFNRLRPPSTDPT